MSDTQPRPDWWQASDGRWYAPALHPSHRAPPVPAQPTEASAEIWSGGRSSSVDAVSPEHADSSKKRRSGLLVAGSTVVAVIVVVFIVATTNRESMPTAATASTVVPAPAAASAAAPPTTAPPATVPLTTAPLVAAPPATTAPVTAPPARAPLTTASGEVHVGAELALTGLDGTKVSVALNQVIDPATGTEGPPRDSNGNLTNSVYIATVVTILDTGSKAIRDDANDDAALIGSDGQNYTPDLDAVHKCTNFHSGEYSIGPGETITGCVVFALPAGVAPAKLQWIPAGFSNDYGEWLIP
jgi:hypothetical protein